MNFGDVAARLKKKQDKNAPAEPVERDHEEVHALRARMVGVLMRDARLANGATQDDVAQALHVTDDQVRDWEFGRVSPSLPQLEMLAYYLGVPVSHFWNTKTMSADQQDRTFSEDQYSALRDRMIGTKLSLARQEAKLSVEELASATGLTESQLTAYEFGQQPIPLAELTSLSSAVRKSISYFLEDSNRVGGWLALQEEYRRFSEIPAEVRAFVTQPVNQPFIDIAMRLSRLQVQELREIAENILNITF
ncbi:MAG: helix-turn-helix transcriptional regulator [Chloroflexota bacterium]